VLPDDLNRLQTDMTHVQQRLARIESDQADAQRRLDELTAGTQQAGEEVTREDLADALLRIDQLSRQVSASDDRVNEVAQRLDRYSGDLAQTRELARRGGPTSPGALPGGAVAGPAAAPGRPPVDRALPDPEALYNSAYADFSKGNYALAIAGFREYQQRFPDTGSAEGSDIFSPQRPATPYRRTRGRWG
jgi:TolA-binding protein